MRTHEKSSGDQKYIHGSWQTIVDDFFSFFTKFFIKRAELYSKNSHKILAVFLFVGTI